MIYKARPGNELQIADKFQTCAAPGADGDPKSGKPF